MIGLIQSRVVLLLLLLLGVRGREKQEAAASLPLLYYCSTTTSTELMGFLLVHIAGLGEIQRLMICYNPPLLSSF
jgi:hypothetical protein